MPTIKMPIWIRSEYVTMSSPPFLRAEGKELPPANKEPTAYRYGSATGIIAYFSIFGNSFRQKPPQAGGFSMRHKSNNRSILGRRK